MKKIWIHYLIAYLMWFIFFLLGVLFLLVSRQGVLGILGNYSRGNLQRIMEAQLIDKAYLLVVGLALLILMIVVEDYFKKGAQKGLLAVRIPKVMGLEILFLFGAHLLLVILGLLGTLSGLQLLLMAIEFLGGVCLLWFGVKPRGKSAVILK